MIVTATELKTNLGKYLDLAMNQDIFITKNGREIAKLTSPVEDKLATLNQLVGIIPKDFVIDEDALREERLAKQCES